MSLAVLTRKSRRYQAPVSGIGEKGFSINGGRRNQGWVGQEIRGRYLSRTPFRGNEPMGAGGCCGHYSKKIVNKICSTNDPGIIKRSTMNTNGYILATVDNPTQVLNYDISGCCTNWVKDFNSLNHSQSIYIMEKGSAAMCVINKSDSGTNYCTNKKCKSASYFIGGKKFYITPYSKDLNTYPTSCSQYIRSGLMNKNCLPTPSCKEHFPMVLNNSFCKKPIKTPEEAINAGLLPKDWLKCIPNTIPGSTDNAFKNYE